MRRWRRGRGRPAGGTGVAATCRTCSGLTTRRSRRTGGAVLPAAPGLLQGLRREVDVADLADGADALVREVEVDERGQHLVLLGLRLVHVDEQRSAHRVGAVRDGLVGGGDAPVATVDLEHLDARGLACEGEADPAEAGVRTLDADRKSTRLNSSHVKSSYAVVS